jgi:hypothetical protein
MPVQDGNSPKLWTFNGKNVSKNESSLMSVDPIKEEPSQTVNCHMRAISLLKNNVFKKLTLEFPFRLLFPGAALGTALVLMCAPASRASSPPRLDRLQALGGRV